MYGVVLHAHPLHGESHIQRNTTGEVATISLVEGKIVPTKIRNEGKHESNKK